MIDQELIDAVSDAESEHPRVLPVLLNSVEDFVLVADIAVCVEDDESQTALGRRLA